MKVLENFIECLQKGNEYDLAALFAEDGVLHDVSWKAAGEDIIHLVGKIAVEMMYHYKFGYNRGQAFPMCDIKFLNDNMVSYFYMYHGKPIPVMACLSEVDAEGKIKHLDILPM